MLSRSGPLIFLPASAYSYLEEFTPNQKAFEASTKTADVLFNPNVFSFPTKLKYKPLLANPLNKYSSVSIFDLRKSIFYDKMLLSSDGSIYLH